MIELEMQGVTLGYNHHPVLEDISLKGRDYLAMIVVFAFGAGLMWLSSYMGWGAGVTGWMEPADLP